MFIDGKTDVALNPNRKGRLIVFEGPDGAGKDTILQMVYRKVYDELFQTQATVPILLESEPTSNSIRNYWLKENHSASATALAMIGDRIDHIYGVLIPALNKGELILCSRFELSTWVYNVYYGDCMWMVKALVTHAKHLLDPDLYIVVDADLKVLVSRLQGDRVGSTSRDDSDMTEGMLRELKRGYKAAISDLKKEELFYFKNNYPVDHPKTLEKINRIVERILSIYPRVP